MSIFQLSAGVQTYDWGKIGNDSKVAQYAGASSGLNVDENKPYAELWMGTHPSCPSKVAATGEDLRQYISAHPELLGQSIINRYGKDLPFLFKVLAIGKALSIQAHPDKALAKQLHEARPDIYKDDNHKPEMAIAITPFSGFCGFLPPKEIGIYLNVVPELASLIPTATISSLLQALSSSAPLPSSSGFDSYQKAIREVFSVVMKTPDETVKKSVSDLISRYKQGGAKHEEASVKDLAIMLEEQYPGDVGVLCVFLLNIVELNPGQAVFLKADEPHAYISGDIIETMATSDNVVRAGLTPKLRDVDTLISMLTYTYQPASKQYMVPLPYRSTRRTLLYDPPIDEFSVLLTHLGPSEEETHEAIDGPSILIVTEGQGKVLWEDGSHQFHNFRSKGEVLFIGAGVPVTFQSLKSTLILYRAFVEGKSHESNQL